MRGASKFCVSEYLDTPNGENASLEAIRKVLQNYLDEKLSGRRNMRTINQNGAFMVHAAIQFAVLRSHEF